MEWAGLLIARFRTYLSMALGKANDISAMVIGMVILQ
jgi:hypothetical protein